MITQVQTIEGFRPLHQDLDRLSRALYAAELVERCTEERTESFEIYRLLLDTLRQISLGDADIDMVLRLLEMSLLDQLGYRPELSHCVMCAANLDSGAIWAPGVGGAICSICRPLDTAVRPLSPDGLRMLRALQGSSPRAVTSMQVSSDVMNAMEAAMREAFHYALDRDIKSAQFIDAVRRPHRMVPSSSAAPK